MRRFSRHDLIALVAISLIIVGCGGTGSSGCAALAPIPTGRYSGPKSDNAINVRLAPAGINYINSNWQQLVSLFAPGNTLNLAVPCTQTSVPVVGDFLIADQGHGAGTEALGRMDGKCDPVTTSATWDAPLNVAVQITGFQLVPRPPDSIEGTVSIAVNTGKIYIDTKSRNAGVCVGLSELKCSLNFNTAAAAPTFNTVKAQVKFSIDTKWDKLLSFEVLTPVNGTQICGASGAPAKPTCLDPDDLNIDGENNCGNVECSALDVGFIKDFILKQISPLLQNQIKDVIALQSCEQCGVGKPACPQLPPSAASTCNTADKVCRDSATGRCVPRFLGVEGRVAVGGLLGNFGVPASSQLDMSVAGGSSVRTDTGINIGTRGGLKAVTVAPCVPPQAAPAMIAVNPPAFDQEATPGTGYHVGVGISSPFLNATFHEAHQSGALCLQLSSATVGLLSTNLFKTFLPSLGKLATRDGRDAPMMVVLRPAKAPKVVVGKGTFDPVTKKPIDPLLLVTLPEVAVDFYAMIDDRFARLFSLSADISLPLSLIFNGCSSVQPAIGDLKMLIANIKTANSEMLAEDPKVLADLIPAVIGLAEPAIASALKPFALPALGNFKLKVNEVKGVGNVTGTKEYNHLGLYATLLPATAACAVSAPTTVASLKRSEIPPASAMVLTGRGIPWPKAVLDVQALGKAGTPEFAFRVDDGTWSTFFAAPNGELVVEHPVFLIQGLHTIEVRSRVEEDQHGISEPVKLGFRVDWDAPEVSVTPDRAAGLVNVTAFDTVSPAGALEFAYRVGDGAFSEFGPPREIALAPVEGQGGVTVRVRDEVGNVGEKTWRAATTQLRDDLPEGAAPAGLQNAGCSQAQGLLPIALLALAGLLRRRRAGNLS